jgi:gas vesicle protein
MTRNAWIWGMLAGAGAGAATMYFLDPERGPGRRAYVRDQFLRLNRQMSDAVSGLGHDIALRSQDVLADTRRLISGTLGEENAGSAGDTAHSSEIYAAGRSRKLNRSGGPGGETPETIH